MIVTEKIVIKDKQFIKTYSSENKYIECDGATYSEAFDLAELGREYIETDIPIETGNELTEVDYINALSEREQIINILTGE